MKTLEEKARAYDKAIERARKLYNSEETSADVEIACENIFPEIFESEDERIRKEIIEYIKWRKITPNHPIADEWISWLEKQAPKPKWSEEDSLMIDSIIDTMKCLEGKGATNMKIDWLESLKQRPK